MVEVGFFGVEKTHWKRICIKLIVKTDNQKGICIWEGA